jgi:hypothetical protein
VRLKEARSLASASKSVMRFPTLNIYACYEPMISCNDCQSWRINSSSLCARIHLSMRVRGNGGSSSGGSSGVPSGGEMTVMIVSPIFVDLKTSL